MGRLIYADDVMEMLTNVELSCTVIPITEAKLKLKDIPTAYDVEEVVAEIEHDLPFIEADDGGGVFVNQRKTIDAIRKGGVG